MCRDIVADVSLGAGRFAPSPSADLHLGNLRTAILAWLFARSEDRPFLLRVDDLDAERSSNQVAQRQLADLRAIGLDWDGEVLWQSQRRAAYAAAINQLTSAGLAYECYCSRKDITTAATAPHALPGAYPGTCRDLSDAQRATAKARTERPPSLRLRCATSEYTVTDRINGSYTGAVDDFVLMRFDGTPAYNLASVVDDAAMGVSQIVRGDDLLPSSPRQAYLASLLSPGDPATPMDYVHVPLALNHDGARLAKRDGAVTLSDLAGAGHSPAWALTRIAQTLRLAAEGEPVTMSRLLDRFDPDGVPTEPWVVNISW